MSRSSDRDRKSQFKKGVLILAEHYMTGQKGNSAKQMKQIKGNRPMVEQS